MQMMAASLTNQVFAGSESLGALGSKKNLKPSMFLPLNKGVKPSVSAAASELTSTRPSASAKKRVAIDF